MKNPLCDHCDKEIVLSITSKFWNEDYDKIIWCKDCGESDFIILSSFGFSYGTNNIGYNAWYQVGDATYNKLKNIKKFKVPVEMHCKICTKKNFSNENICWWCGATKSYFQPSI